MPTIANELGLRRRRWLVICVAGGAMLLVLGVVFAFYDREPAEEVSSTPEPRVRLLDRIRTKERPLAGDPDHGRRLYALHCVSCHGIQGDGSGPAAAILWPPPRDHSDGGYMNSRSDQDLYRAIAEGGRAVSRSPLMPPWNDRFDPFEIWNLVAHIRTLHPRPPDSVQRTTYHEVILSETRAQGIGQTLGISIVGGDHRVVFHRGFDQEKRLVTFAIFPRVPIEGNDILLAVLCRPDAAMDRVFTIKQIVLRGTPADAVDRYLAGLDQSPSPIPGYEDICDRLSVAVRKSELQIRAALEQEKEDISEAEGVDRAAHDAPERLPLGQRLYLRNCASCHGTTGRVVGPGIIEREFRPRNHADGSLMNLLSDDYVRSVIKYGGLHWNLSGSMPSHPAFSEEELTALLNFVRSLSVPRGDGRCPCATLGDG